ncbi:TolA protein [Pseudonocardia sp. Ae168_Ps1]|uniref:hypothetical protein n=1 Tax=unclassified Pseudonocardia TaxID=2619320 RepID=UPI00094AD0B1|nr:MULTISPECIES: hypothetical protein [unclassified Pseudonocardia]OLL76156.1 TolA protein [Pseudonocardia sp. Ae150A_Ps1]OLL82155.1 TolA protein [Pseudonocardia sp. Ae168_Ps1]OLL83731.1 TolA protein [Pseudonocardia sp. Ae263_Ps1]OLL90229.1 TolA protein [Pseudonocardia sp. Ae356_Ps1]
MVDNDGVAEDVRDDETTRAGDTAPDLPRRSPSPSRGGDGARAEVTGGEQAPEDPGTRLADAERARVRAEAARDEAVRRADALAAALDEARARPAETFGIRADKVLRMADHEAAQRRRAAEQEAGELRRQALAEAARITAAAHAEAERTTAAARAEAERLAVDAAGEHERQRAAGVAARRNSELVADTAASMHAHVSELRSSVRDEIARLHSLLGAELGRLDGPARPSPGRSRDTDPPPAVPPARAPGGGGAHTLREPAPAEPATAEPAISEPATGDLPAVSLPEQRAADSAPVAGAEDGPEDGPEDGSAAEGTPRAGDAEPARTSGDTGPG